MSTGWPRAGPSCATGTLRAADSGRPDPDVYCGPMDRLSKPQTAAMVAVALGFVLILAGLAALLLYDVPLRFALACDRAAGDCVFTQTLITGAYSGSLPVGALERAEAR